jgi:hypothetical protein
MYILFHCSTIWSRPPAQRKGTPLFLNPSRATATHWTACRSRRCGTTGPQEYPRGRSSSNGVVIGGGRRGEDECWRPGAGGHGAGAPERPGLPRGRHRLSRLPCLLRRRQVLRSRPLPYSWGHLRIYLKPPSQQHGKIVCLCSLLLSVFIRIYLKPRPAALIAAVVYLDLYMHVL